MKKNIQINLFGTLYNIDDDAYQLLENYLDSMKSYFSRQDGGEEIADDIEHRVAELLWQHKQYGMEAVNIETVKEIIAQIGNPQDIDDGVESDATYTEYEEQRSDDTAADATDGEKDSFTSDVKKNVTRRRLYRNPNDKMLGGVCSGLAQYVGKGDVTLWRLGFVAMPFLLDLVFTYVGSITHFLHLTPGSFWFAPSAFWILPVAYIVMCIIVPEARTAEDRLRMKGADVTPENINAQVISDTTGDDTVQPTQSSSSSGGGCLKALLMVILFFCALPFLFIIIVMLLVVVFAVAAMAGMNGWSLPFINVMQSDMGISNTFFSDYGWLVVSGSIAGLLVIVIPLYMIIKRIMGGSFGRHSILIMSIVWLLMLVWAIFSMVACGTSFQKYVPHIDAWPGILPADTMMSQPPSPWEPMEELEDTAAIDLMSE